MIHEIISEAVNDAEAVKALTVLFEQLRTIASNDASPEREARENAAVAKLLSAIPEDKTFRMLEHCSTLTRLYAIWERCVTRAIRLWLDELPSYQHAYTDLGQTFASNHRRGVGRVLLDLDKDRFSHLSVHQVISGLVDASSGSATYSILPEAFLFDNRSLKRERLDEVFAQVRLEGGWDWICKHRFITEFLTNVRGDQNTAEAELRSFVNYRNEAAHGNVDQVLGTGPLTETAEFVSSLCRALGEFVLWNQVTRKEASGKLRRAGKVSEHFRDNVVVAKLSDCKISVGCEVFLYGEKYCYRAKVESIQLNDVSHEEVQIEHETEVGIKFDTNTQKRPVILTVPISV